MAEKKAVKKSVVIALVAFVLALLAIGGTIAYFQARTPEYKNKFQPGIVASKILSDTNTSGEVANVRVENKGTVDIYVRACVVINWKNAAGNVYGSAPVKDTDYNIVFNTDDWELHGGFYYYTKDGGKLPANSETTPLVRSCKPVATAPEGYTLSVELCQQAIQADPEKAVTEAWGSGLPLPVNP